MGTLREGQFHVSSRGGAQGLEAKENDGGKETKQMELNCFPQLVAGSGCAFRLGWPLEAAGRPRGEGQNTIGLNGSGGKNGASHGCERGRDFSGGVPECN